MDCHHRTMVLQEQCTVIHLKHQYLEDQSSLLKNLLQNSLHLGESTSVEAMMNYIVNDI